MNSLFFVALPLLGLVVLGDQCWKQQGAGNYVLLDTSIDCFTNFMPKDAVQLYWFGFK
jgi:hypothetical protein